MQLIALDLPALDRPANATSLPVSGGHCESLEALVVYIALRKYRFRSPVSCAGWLIGCDMPKIYDWTGRQQCPESEAAQQNAQQYCWTYNSPPVVKSGC